MKDKKLLLIVLILVLFVSIGKETYALFTSSVSSVAQSYGTGTLKLSYSNSVINLNNAYPMSDSDGMNTGSGIITITNTGTLAYKFDVKIDVSSSSTLSNDLIKVSVDEQNPDFLSTDGNVIIRDIILNPGSSRSFSLKLWIDSNATSSEVLGKKFIGNLTSTGIAVKNMDDSVGTVLVGPNKLYDYIKNNADTTTQIDFSQTSAASNTNGIYTTTNTDSGKPVYYYRGDVDNRVVFANFCWRIVRTTETGGVKLIYDGVPTVDTSSYNTVDRSKYTVSNDTTWPFIYDSKNKTWKSGVVSDYEEYVSIKFSDFEAGSYQLEINVYNDMGEDEVGVALDNKSVWYKAGANSDTINLELTSSSVLRIEYTRWSATTDGSDYIEFTLKKAASSCNNTGDATTIGNYYFSQSDNDDAKYAGYMYGSGIDDTANTTDSTIKTVIDTWYKNNMTSYTSQLEDTVFCNDRSYTPSDDYFSLHFGAYTRLLTGNRNPSLKCQNTKDKFTVSTSNGNGDLTYPIGLITADEMAYAGATTSSNTSFYLYNEVRNWLLSPCYFSTNNFGFAFDKNTFFAFDLSADLYVRPSVSLQPGIAMTGGSGTATDPFIV